MSVYLSLITEILPMVICACFKALKTIIHIFGKKLPIICFRQNCIHYDCVPKFSHISSIHCIRNSVGGKKL